MSAAAAGPHGAGGFPASDLDPFDDAVLRDPYPSYRRLRDAGPVVWLRRHDVWALPRHAEVRWALADWATFSSAAGVGMVPEYNDRPGGILGCDPPQHDRQRRIFHGQLSARALRPIEDGLSARAASLVERLCARGSFDAVRDLAEPYVVSAVADLAGLPEEGRSALPAISDAAFNRFGPRNPRFVAAEAGFQRLLDYVTTVAVPGRLRPGGKGAEIYQAARDGLVDPADCPSMMMVYAWPSVDTTIRAIGTTIRQLASHPDQWDLVRDDPGLVTAAFDEALRFDAPVQMFTRVTTRPVDVGDVTLPAGARVMLMMGSANRDERHHPAPDRYDVRRDPIDHLAFGHGVHHCVGAALARLEAHAVLRALARQATRLTLVDHEEHLNNVIRGPATVRVDTR